MEAKGILSLAATALNNKKAVDICAIEIGDLTIIADYFLMASATSSTHVRALADAVEEKLSENGIEPNHIEGKSTDWILLDYGDVVVHVFGQKSKEFYSLDKMWSDGNIIDINELIKE
ncbi:MAG: ribosome silencing factor [bacterium]|nr:ribosome silencing factor [bacterium]